MTSTIAPAWPIRVWRSWAFRSAAVGLLAVGLDLSLGLSLRALFGVPDRYAAMAGVVTGSLFTYFANRAFTFKDSSRIRDTLWRFALVIGSLSVIHGQVLVLVRTHLDFPYVFAKFAADLMVLTVPQIFLMKYWVFRPRPPGPRIGDQGSAVSQKSHFAVRSPSPVEGGEASST